VPATNIPPPTPDIVGNADAPPPPTSVPTDQIPTIAELQAATVQIFARQRSGSRMVTLWTGSGSIISPDGLVLTNAHVADPTAPGLASLYNDPEFLFADPPDVLTVAMVEAADRPPVERFQAVVAAVDGPLDLAVLQIVADRDGNPLNAAELDLPYVNIGDSDTIQLGDEVRVLGFPGSGGETITFTRGDVSGFESQERIGFRAWIKTDTVFSPGNSGGMAVDSQGQLIGIPSYVLEAQGGAINRLRSVNLALPLVESARSASVYTSPHLVPSTGIEQFQLVTWAEDFDEAGCALGAQSGYQVGVTAVVAIFNFKGLRDGEQITEVWFRDEELVDVQIFTWAQGERGECAAFYTHNFGDPLPAGSYSLEIYAGDDPELVASATVQVGSESAATSSGGGDGVAVVGRITDESTGLPIAGAGVFFLYPGVDLDAWIDNPTDADILTSAETDADGRYALPALLERGNSYPGVAAATGYRPNSGYLEVFVDDPDTLTVDLTLGR
jgi:putative serine protease PepD